MNATAPKATNTDPGPLAAAWRWSVRRSPILNTFRWFDHRLHPQQLAAERLEGSGLPEPVGSCIAEIVRRTRLLATERDQVCRELINHCEDALRESQSPADDGSRVAESLGDPKAAALLIRRAMKRKRSVFFQARTWLMRATGWGFAALVLLYVGLFVRFQMGSPSVKTDYVAMLNAPTLATPQRDRAIGVYQNVHEAWMHINDELESQWKRHLAAEPSSNITTKPLDALPAIDPAHPQADTVREAILAFRPQLDRLHEASRRPIMGYLYHTQLRDEDQAVNAGAFTLTHDDALFGVLLTHLGQLRTEARLLAADARLAAADGNAQRATDDLLAVADTSRLLASDPFLISDLVAMSIHNLASSEIRRHLAQSPDLFTAEQLLVLSHTLSASAELAETTDLRGETYLFEDLLQRAFTDDGHGDGRLTPNGLTTLMGFSGNGRIEPGAATRLTGPVSMEFVASRAQLSALHRHHIQMARDTLARGPEALPELRVESQRFERMGPIEEARFLPVALILPALDRAVENMLSSRIRTDATIVALAAEHHRRVTGDYPATLDQLVPGELPTLPPDPFEPGTPMKYRLTETGPTVYVAGSDGDDDGGVPPTAETEPESRWNRHVSELRMRFTEDGRPMHIIPDADWILFPPQDD